MARPTSASIHTDALRHNLAQARARAPHSRVMAVVKADGYGHGLERVARALEGADAFGVAALSDADRLRAAGLSQPIVLLSGFDEADDLPQLRRLGVETVVHHLSQIEMLEQAADGEPIRCWLKVDTGMHRLGFAPEQVREAYARLSALAGVADGIVLMNHFASSDEFANPQTPAQLRAFGDATAGLGGARSLANSAAVLGWPDAHADWIRPGGALYGISVVEGTTGADFGLRPAMTLSTRLIAVNRVRRGERIGYAATWECPEDMNVGVAAIGYGDGYPRAAPSGTPVLVGGQATQVIGRVSMDLMTIDLRGIPDARVGDPVTLWGPELPVERIAEVSGTIGYELTCSITRRVRFVET
ncbi:MULTISPECIES: alanine racemase [unclassified Lysobacter]|uniref:alanine racemase n=1 Tax=unclassified Lysobacter TaxID=2635362 RepID=UPI0006FBF4E1|nr:MULTISPECIES: alanine racemase [unclassified Lysobacter]KRA20880.1 alanine racemase [Lysobacter sp. Root604]KRD39888.1 alanine racemase [Lysobacter sp. Root916]KRD79915.1 alanine racemase [Lysobacter sp. Root983]